MSWKNRVVILLVSTLVYASSVLAKDRGVPFNDILQEHSSSLVSNTYWRIRDQLQLEPDVGWLEEGEWIGRQVKGDFYRVHWMYVNGGTGTEVRGMPWRICPTWGQKMVDYNWVHSPTQPGTYDFYGYRTTKLGEHEIEDRVFLGRKVVAQECYFGWIYNGWEYYRCEYESR